MSSRILIVDDEEGIRTFISEALEAVGHKTFSVKDGYEASGILSSVQFDAMVTDLKMPRMDGMKLLESARRIAPDMEVVVLTAHGSIEGAVEAMKLGAFDYLTKPLEGPKQLRMVVKRALEHRDLGRGKRVLSESTMVSVDPAMESVRRMIAKVATTDATVLLLGESGTGKEVAAMEIHRLSKRGGDRFVAVNCAAISPQLVESEMFGHEKGAFTGAVGLRQGRFELANHGTLFLDEVGELPIDLQAKLLRVLDERRFERVGGTETLEVDVRIIAATNRDLGILTEKGAFREDLYHRLSVFPIEIPPLRSRPSDLLPLSKHLLSQIGRRLGVRELTLSEEAVTKLASYSWPGNVRELSNVLERAAILADDLKIEAGQLMLIGQQNRDLSRKEAMTLRDAERTAIENALTTTDGHRKKAAELLGISLRTLYNKLKEYGLD